MNDRRRQGRAIRGLALPKVCLIEATKPPSHHRQGAGSQQLNTPSTHSHSVVP